MRPVVTHHASFASRMLACSPISWHYTGIVCFNVKITKWWVFVLAELLDPVISFPLVISLHLWLQPCKCLLTASTLSQLSEGSAVAQEQTAWELYTTCKPVERKPLLFHHLYHTAQYLSVTSSQSRQLDIRHILYSAGMINTLLITNSLSQGAEVSKGVCMWAGGCGEGGRLQGSCSLCPTAMEARVLRLATQPPALALSLHATPLSNPLFDNYLLCCLGQGWGHHTYITDTKTLPTHVCPPLFDLYRSPLLNTLKILRITGLQDGMIKWLSVKCCCWVNTHIIILLVSL